MGLDVKEPDVKGPGECRRAGRLVHLGVFEMKRRRRVDTIRSISIQQQDEGEEKGSLKSH